MPRLVVPGQQGVGRFASADIDSYPKDTYKDRLVKYIPAESLALYTFTDKLLVAYYGIDATGAVTRAPKDAILAVAPWALFLLGLIGTPVYLYRQRLPNQPWKMNAVISTIAFCFWAYTLDGSLVMLNHWYNIVLAGVAAPVFTFVAGAFEPKKT